MAITPFGRLIADSKDNARGDSHERPTVARDKIGALIETEP